MYIVMPNEGVCTWCNKKTKHPLYIDGRLYDEKCARKQHGNVFAPIHQCLLVEQYFKEMPNYRVRFKRMKDDFLTWCNKNKISTSTDRCKKGVKSKRHSDIFQIDSSNMSSHKQILILRYLKDRYASIQQTKSLYGEPYQAYCDASVSRDGRVRISGIAIDSYKNVVFSYCIALPYRVNVQYAEYFALLCLLLEFKHRHLSNIKVHVDAKIIADTMNRIQNVYDDKNMKTKLLNMDGGTVPSLMERLNAKVKFITRDKNLSHALFRSPQRENVRNGKFFTISENMMNQIH